MRNEGGLIRKCLDSNTFLEFLKYIKENNSDFNNSFEESQAWNLELLYPLIISFEISDKIRLERLEAISQEELLSGVKSLEEEFSSEIECLTEEFTKFLIGHHFEDIKTGTGSISETITHTTNEYYGATFLE